MCRGSLGGIWISVGMGWIWGRWVVGWSCKLLHVGGGCIRPRYGLDVSCLGVRFICGYVLSRYCLTWRMNVFIVVGVGITGYGWLLYTTSSDLY